MHSHCHADGSGRAQTRGHGPAAPLPARASLVGLPCPWRPCFPGRPYAVAAHPLRRPCLVAGLLKRQLDGAGELVDFPQQASRCAASSWEVHVGRSQSVDSAGAYLARKTTPCLAIQRRRDTGEWRMCHRWQPRYSTPRGARVCLGLSGTVLRDNGLLMLLGSRHTTRPAHAGVSGHRTTVSPHVLYCIPTNPGPRSFCARPVRRYR